MNAFKLNVGYNGTVTIDDTLHIQSHYTCTNQTLCHEQMINLICYVPRFVKSFHLNIFDYS